MQKITSQLLRVCFGLCTTGSLFVSGCSGAETTAPAPSEAVETGTLSLPLTTTAGGHTYALVADFQMSSYSGSWFNYVHSDGTSSELSVDLPTGDYYVTLNNWQLFQVDADGQLKNINAQLVSSNWKQFSVYNGSTSTVSFQFETDGVVVNMGAGKVNIQLDVAERAPICAPLGTDCAEGSWCPPSGLTGSPLACVAAGTLPLGAECNLPGDCVGNSSCIDVGAGPVCTGLCSAADFDKACGQNGTCTAQGSEYGICVPNPTSSVDAGASAQPTSPQPTAS